LKTKTGSVAAPEKTNTETNKESTKTDFALAALRAVDWTEATSDSRNKDPRNIVHKE
jgi:hypothetical protein